MKRVTILFSSGSQIQFNVVDFTVNKNVSGEFRGFNWTNNAELGPQIVRIKPESVDAVLVEEISDESEESAQVAAEHSV